MCKLNNFELEVNFVVIQTVIDMIYCIIVYFWNLNFEINDQGYVFTPTNGYVTQVLLGKH